MSTENSSEQDESQESPYVNNEGESFQNVSQITEYITTVDEDGNTITLDSNGNIIKK